MSAWCEYMGATRYSSVSSDDDILDMSVVFLPVAPYRYLLPNLYLSVADLLVCGCRTWISIDIARFYDEQCSHPAGPHGQLALKTVNRVPIFWNERDRVGYVVWSLKTCTYMIHLINISILANNLTWI